MAESSGEKTEMPTPKKLRDARQKGQVCTSKDIVSTAILVVLFALLGWMGVALVDDGAMLLDYIGDRMQGDPSDATRPAAGLAVFVICKHSFIIFENTFGQLFGNLRRNVAGAFRDELGICN